MTELEKAEKKLKLKKMDAHVDEMKLNQLKMKIKVENLDKEIALQVEAMNEIKQQLEQGE